MKTSLTSMDYLLDEKVNFYEKILNQIPDLIFQLTISQENEFYLSYLNKSIISFFEINEFDLNQNALDLFNEKLHPDDKESFFNSLYISKQTLKSWTCEFRILLKNKSVKWFKVDANVALDAEKNAIFYCNLTNISTIKSRELKVSESETRYQFALEASKKGIWDYNIKTGEVFFSKESLQMIQFNEHDNINTNSQWDERIHPDDLTNYLQNIESHKLNKIPFFENTKRVLAKDGTYIWVLSRGKIIERDENGNPLRIIGTHSDVTSNKEKEQELLGNLDIIIEQNNRLLNFAHIVSHNLRSHTGNFKMLLNMFDESDDPVNREECISYLKTTSNALSETIDHLKELVDIHTTIIHKKEDLNLKLFLNQTLEVLSKEIKDNKVIIVNKIGEKDTIKFNPAYLESLFLNFTTNAIKYSHPERKPEIHYSSRKEDGKLVLLIQDNGLGINLEKYGEKLFGMYKTFHKNDNARGIGLFITKNQIESMGGTIEVESKVNVGTTFKINFNEEV
ncbi:PAS domain-containing protein [Flavobacterium sp. SUN052]|uniref:PAS domain-containing sensor histidine kinase n=1 Tax=Flavobacterium sp. SUN052 TaxID=3002441 RepID=UPI00237DC0F1|nr:PAS domain-containing protein [Flavobacterium sp. SUN052]MEC4005559.1 PAS domain-containing protein [Flavobacterium sp. SUN052]